MTVPSLAVPDVAFGVEAVVSADAVRLFVDRARSARSAFTITADNAGAVAQLCRRLDGIPLAIELAAARVGSMNPTEIAARLDQRFRLLTGGSRTASSRHQTLRRAIDWSYELLDAPEKALLGRLAVCAGGFDLAAAESIGAGGLIDALDVDDLVCRLVDKDFFAYAAYKYLREHPPHSRCLVEYGADFADFLARFAPCQDLPYLADVARFEWALNIAATVRK